MPRPSWSLQSHLPSVPALLVVSQVVAHNRVPHACLVPSARPAARQQQTRLRLGRRQRCSGGGSGAAAAGACAIASGGLQL